ncbi:hypothetical protein EN943_04625 [Mesorhizobium sp. M7A.F.Ca.US.006.01.1.1]|nr:hypothetical protein EN943_04625 [Mesorhizobium sp. M7A.F.Ca.US.006.01.1.1]
MKSRHHKQRPSTTKVDMRRCSRSIIEGGIGTGTGVGIGIGAGAGAGTGGVGDGSAAVIGGMVAVASGAIADAVLRSSFDFSS